MTTATLHIDITMEASSWGEELREAEAIIRKATLAAWQRADAAERDTEVSIVLGDDAMVRSLNRVYRDQDKPTNVLSFPGAGDETPEGAPCLLGDIVLAYGTVAREAGEQGKTLFDHVSHLCVHGMLHLLGYDHEADKEAEEMEALEVSILAGLGIPDPFAAKVLEA